jgi:lipopolysaccharide transport system ATP-binding protein
LGDVARSGRTVLFVSHNMDAVLSLCTQVIVLQDGRASERMAPLEGVSRYLESGGKGDGPLINRPRYQYQPRANIFSQLEIRSEAGQDNIVPAGTGCAFTVEMVNIQDVLKANLIVALTNDHGQRIVTFGSQFHNGPTFGGSAKASVTVYVPSLPLTPGAYMVDLLLTNERHALERLEQAGRLEIVFADLLGSGRAPSYKQGHTILPCQWRDLKIE